MSDSDAAKRWFMHLDDEEDLDILPRSHTLPVDLYLGLTYLQSAQHPILEKLGHDNVEKDTLARYGQALMIECAEFTNATPWKMWKVTPPDPERMVEELVDVLHFLGTWICLLRHFGITPRRIVQEFAKKNQINNDRLDGKVEGYGISPDNVSIKGDSNA